MKIGPELRAANRTLATKEKNWSGTSKRIAPQNSTELLYGDFRRHAKCSLPFRMQALPGAFALAALIRNLIHNGGHMPARSRSVARKPIAARNPTTK